MFERAREKGFEVLTLHHAEAILNQDMPEAVAELEAVLDEIRIPASELISGGGGEGKGTQRLRRALAAKGWIKHCFEITKTVDGVQKDRSPMKSTT